MALEWLDEIEARANAATPGPWRPVYEDAFNPAEDDDVDKRDAYWVAGPDYVERTYDGYSFWNKADAEFVAAAREDIPRLCRGVRELYNALSSLVSAVGGNEFIGPITLARQGTPAAWALAEAQDVLRRWGRGDA